MTWRTDVAKTYILLVTLKYFNHTLTKVITLSDEPVQTTPRLQLIACCDLHEYDKPILRPESTGTNNLLLYFGIQCGQKAKQNVHKVNTHRFSMFNRFCLVAIFCAQQTLPRIVKLIHIYVRPRRIADVRPLVCGRPFTHCSTSSLWPFIHSLFSHHAVNIKLLFIYYQFKNYCVLQRSRFIYVTIQSI